MWEREQVARTRERAGDTQGDVESDFAFGSLRVREPRVIILRKDVKTDGNALRARRWSARGEVILRRRGVLGEQDCHGRARESGATTVVNFVTYGPDEKDSEPVDLVP